MCLTIAQCICITKQSIIPITNIIQESPRVLEWRHLLGCRIFWIYSSIQPQIKIGITYSSFGYKFGPCGLVHKFEPMENGKAIPSRQSAFCIVFYFPNYIHLSPNTMLWDKSIQAHNHQ